MTYSHFMLSLIYEAPPSAVGLAVIEQRLGFDKKAQRPYTEVLHQIHLEQFSPRTSMPEIANRLDDIYRDVKLLDRSSAGVELVVSMGVAGGRALLSLIDIPRVTVVKFQQGPREDLQHASPISVALPDILGIFLRDLQTQNFRPAPGLDLEDEFKDQLSRLKPKMADIKDEDCELALAAALACWRASTFTPRPRLSSLQGSFRAKTQFEVFARASGT